MAGIITYPWARPHGYNPKLKLKKKEKKKTTSKQQTSEQEELDKVSQK